MCTGARSVIMRPIVPSGWGTNGSARSLFTYSALPPRCARCRYVVPSYSPTVPSPASQSRIACSRIESNTGCMSLGELLMTRRISAVAACCSRVSSCSRSAAASLAIAGCARFWPFARRAAGFLPLRPRVPRVPMSGIRGLSLIFQRECRHRLREALEGQRPNGIAFERTVERGHRLAVEKHLSGFGFGAETRGEVSDVADRGVVPASLEADRAEGGVALRDADAERELVAALLP